MSTASLVRAASRRRFLKQVAVSAGVFVLGTYVPFLRRVGAQEVSAVPQGIIDPNVFLKIAPDGIVTLISKKFEMGQGITTGLATLVAEELDVPWANMRFEFAPNDATRYNNLVFGPVMATGGTTSMVEAYDQMRQVGAAARAMFIAAAAQSWGVPAASITLRDGSLHAPDKARHAGLGDFVADAMKQPVPKTVTLKDPKDWKLVGTHVPRLDSGMKTDGAAKFGIDARRPGMLTAVIQRPEHFGATVRSFDDTQARKVKGVVNVVAIPQGVAVIATDTWSAMRGRDALSIQWDTTKAEMRSSDEMWDEYRRLAGSQGLSALKRGDAAGRVATAQHTLDAEFTFPFLAHTPMEPLNGLIEVRDGSVETWMGSQLQSLDTPAIAQALGLSPDKVKINTVLGGGSFGRRGSTMADWARELGDVAKAAGTTAPIHVIWTREDDIRGGFYRPMALHRVRAGIDAKGRIAWQHVTVSKSIFTGTPFEGMAVKNGLDSSAVEGIVDTPYRIDDFSVDVHMATSPVPVLWYRSVGHSHTAHVMETIIDELAHLAGQDPYAFRMRLLADQPRDAAVLKLAAEKGNWGSPMPKGRGDCAIEQLIASYRRGHAGEGLDRPPIG